MRTFRNFILSGVLALTAMVPVLVPAVAIAAPRDDVCAGIGLTGGSCDGGETEVNNVIAQVVNILSMVVGVAGVIMVIFGGFRYITSGGDSNKVSSAKSTIMYALIGLVVAVLAQVLVRFVLNKAVPPPPAPAGGYIQNLG